MTAAKKTAAKRVPAKKAAAPKAPEPMDPDAVEVPTPVDTQRHAPITARNSWGIDTLIAEVHALYPEATVFTSERTKRDVGIAVTFEGWDAHHENEPGLDTLLACCGGDERVAEVTAAATDDQGDNPWVSVRLYDNPVTMDSRDSFRLDEAYRILTDAVE